MNIDDLITFLSVLEPDYQTHEFMWFGLHPEGQRLQAAGTLESILPQLIKRNEQGYGIFVCINAIDYVSYEGDYPRRRIEDVTRVRSCFADWDNPNKPVGDLPIRPTMAVSTSQGKYHFYWCMESNSGYDLTQFEPIQRSIIAALNTDPTSKDLNRVLRVPGFLHTKDMNNRQEVKLLFSNGPRYTFAQLKEAFPMREKKPSFSSWDGKTIERTAALTAAVIGAMRLPRPDGGYNIRCPWAHEHTTPDSQSCSVYWPPSELNDGRGSYKCMHAHCVGRMVDELDKWIFQKVEEATKSIAS